MPQNENSENQNPQKIVQTAGRAALGEFAPDFARFNDDILFGENWNNHDIDLKTRCIITVVALMAQGITDDKNFEIMVQKACDGSKGSFAPLTKEDIIEIYKAAF